MRTVKKVCLRVISWLLNGLFAPACPICQTATEQPHQLCQDCLGTLPQRPENHCVRCGTWTLNSQTGCLRCVQDGVKAADAAYFAFRYQGHLAALIRGMKFSDHSEWGTLLGRLFWHRLQAELTWESPDIIIPIPLHPRRLIARRYNQSALLAGMLARFLDRPLVTNGLKRVKMTRSQARLNARKRDENVRGAFRAHEKRVADRAILLVDDVFTTGATTRAAVWALKRAGAGRVVVVCLAVAQPEQHTKEVDQTASGGA